MGPDNLKVLSPRALRYLALALVMGWLPALLGSGEVARVAGMYALSASPTPYFQPSHAGLFYFLTPLIVVSSFLLYLSPGALLVLALGRARSAGEWLVLAFGSSLALSVILGTGIKLLLRVPLTYPVQMTLWVGAAALAWLFLAARLRRQAALPLPIAQWPDVRRMLWMLGATMLAVAALAPKIFWENFNLDGIEAFEFGRSLTTHVLPYWDIHDGTFGFYHNFVLFAYPNHWFITLFGPVEAAARLPFFLYVAVLFAALLILIERSASRQLSGLEEAAIWLGLALYTIVQTFNTNYEPFFADLAEMAATDTLQVVCFLATCYALWTKQWGWFGVFALMTYTATPGGLLLLGGLAVAVFIARSPDRRQHVVALAGVLLICVAIGLAYHIFYNQMVLGGVNDQFSAKNLLRRLFPPTVTEFVRFNALLFCSGLLPALSLLTVRRRDAEGWAIAGVTIIYFGVLYLQAWTALHQFTPVMVLPLVVFWRSYLGSSLRAQRLLLPAVAATTALVIFLSLPRHFQVNQAIREFGLATAYEVGDYEQAYEAAARGGWSLYALLPQDYRLQYPEQPWGSDPYCWIHYCPARLMHPDRSQFRI